ncbi:hypothetical protein RclHR1_00830021 [Rhizophagus clarus]|uniref:DNA-directed DNA polymerase n=1 Tax=Rhizophagus clarus TaxID=94130 RepID=A0A2Z6SET3_9GLOM|nr:hypothetical protein RclHR1_00830021 [Rhizophagus clarus]GES90785.1 DNA polymerase gamma [Rhizophagus clarus]
MKAWSNLAITTRHSAIISRQKYLVSLYTFKQRLICTSSGAEENKKRVNEVDIEMLPKWLHNEVFPHSCQKPDQKKVGIAVKHLKLQGLFEKETEKVRDVPKFKIPKLCGDSIAKHFWNIGESQTKKYRDLAEEFAKLDLLEIPLKESWSIEPGWTRYESDKEPESVEFPKEQLLCLDVETLLSKSDYGLIACAASPYAWYTWISPHLFEIIKDFENNEKSATSEKIKANKVLEKKIGNLIPMGQIKDRIIVGHNISFDRARIKEEYNYKRTDNKFIDTLALHVAISGLCARQRSTWIKYDKALEEKDIGYLDDKKDFQSIYDVSSTNNLRNVYKLYCGGELDKSTRKEFFVNGTLEDIIIEKNLRHLITYCANDVLATFQVFKKVLPRFLQVCPHPVSFAGMLEMGNMFLTTSKDWDIYLQTAEEVYQKQRDAIETRLEQLADRAVQNNPKLIEDDQWLKQLDWTRPPRAKKLPGFPVWYRDIYCSKERKIKVTIKSLIAPLLLKLKWHNFPIYYSRKYGWMYRVPKYADYQTNVTACEFNDELKDSKAQFNDEEQEPSKRKKRKKSSTKSTLLNNDNELFANDEDGIYYRIPHKDGEEARCGSPLAKYYVTSFEKGVLSSEHEVAKDALQMNATCSYWVSSRDRIRSQMVVYDDHPEIVNMGFDKINDKIIGMIIPQTVTMGTVTRRAVEKTWMTASNVKENRIGSELKAIIQAPEGYKFVGADVDSEELWIASLMGDSQFGFHGATAMGWMTLQGNKSAGTDLHSRTASILNISRSDAKVFNYGRIYGAGLKFAVQLLKQFNETIIDSEALERATALYSRTKGKRYIKKKPAFWYGGSESYMFNSLEEIAIDEDPKTPVLKCGITGALKENVVNKNYMTSRINWVVQSSGVDYLHLLLVSMQYLMTKYNIDGRFMLSVHDEVRFLVKEKDSYRAALALQISNLWTRAMFSYMLGINDLPLSTAFFSAVDIDHILRKEVEMKCKTISYDIEIEEGKSLTIQKLIELNTQLDEESNKDNEDYNIKELDNSSELLTPYNNNKSEEHLEIQSLSTEEEVEALMSKNSTKNLRYYQNNNFEGIRSKKKNELHHPENSKLRKRTLIYEK